ARCDRRALPAGGGARTPRRQAAERAGSRQPEVLGLAADADRMALRKRYSELVRRYHPDRNGGDRSHETMLQQVIAAYQQLRQAPAFA
ncbi:J domain-containing protein, partial [Enterococcus faecium]|uniref:J domain-containing protein n=1 Tax=Enterococcus faecium TaxID=1352 RepID=UPI003F52832B